MLNKSRSTTGSVVAALLLPGVACAQSLPDSALTRSYLDAMRLDAKSPSLRLRDGGTATRFNTTSTRTSGEIGTLTVAGARLVEVPRTDAPGTYSRPHYALGFRSETMRSWLNGVGVDATSCLAPVVRLRTKFSSSGQVSGTLWLSARCDIR
jgi:hypothetical protein